MNISQHVILALKWKLGQFRPNGDSVNTSVGSLTSFFPVFAPLRPIFLIPSNWETIYGRLLYNVGANGQYVVNMITPSSPFTLYDSSIPNIPSKPLSIIIY